MHSFMSYVALHFIEILFGCLKLDCLSLPLLLILCRWSLTLTNKQKGGNLNTACQCFCIHVGVARVYSQETNLYG